MKMKVRFAVAGLMAMVGTMAFSTGVSAASYQEWIYTSDGSPYGGIARWIENGDRLETCDNEADGWGVEAYIFRVSDGATLIDNINTGGNGYCNSKSKDLPENVELELMVCLEKGNGTTNTYCNIEFVRTF